MPNHIKKGDVVIVIKGASKGVVGEVLRVETEGDRVVVKGANIRTFHLKRTQTRPQGTILKQEAPIHRSNVNPSIEGKASRVRFVTKADGSKVRVAVRGGKELSTLHGPRGAVKKTAGTKVAKVTKAATATKAPKATKAAKATKA